MFPTRNQIRMVASLCKVILLYTTLSITVIEIAPFLYIASFVSSMKGNVNDPILIYCDIVVDGCHNNLGIF